MVKLQYIFSLCCPLFAINCSLVNALPIIYKLFVNKIKNEENAAF